MFTVSWTQHYSTDYEWNTCTINVKENFIIPVLHKKESFFLKRKHLCFLFLFLSLYVRRCLHQIKNSLCTYCETWKRNKHSMHLKRSHIIIINTSKRAIFLLSPNRVFHISFNAFVWRCCIIFQKIIFFCEKLYNFFFIRNKYGKCFKWKIRVKDISSILCIYRLLSLVVKHEFHIFFYFGCADGNEKATATN